MAFLCSTLLVALLAPPQPTIQLVPSSGEQPARIRITGLSDKVDLDDLRVYVVPSPEAAIDDQPAVLGKVSRDEEGIWFRPRFDFEPGVLYRVRLGQADETVSLPKKPTSPTTVVEHVYPTSERLPTNVLRFYVAFSQPMSRGDSYRHIRLLNSDGVAVDLPFLELDEELWDAESKRMTLYIDPGRIKREVKPRVDLGPVFVPGQKYTLLISKNWKDAEGLSLKADYRKEITAVEPFRGAHDPKTWKITPAKAGTNTALKVRFPRPLDQALARRMIRVVTADNHNIEGEASIHEKELLWKFQPKANWKPGRYRLVIDSALEDIAGNRIDGAFEVDVFEKAEPVRRTFVEVPFTVGR